VNVVDYKVPFYANTADDTHCFQAALRMVLKFFWPNNEYTWEELEVATAKVEGLWTWYMAGLLWLQKNGFEVIVIETFDYEQFIQDKEKYLLDTFGKEVAEEQIKNSDIDQEIEYARRFVEEINPEARVPTVHNITQFLEDGYLVICGINSRALNNKEGFAGHSIVIKGTHNDGFILHDPGLPPIENRVVSFDEFEKAWAYPNDIAKNIMAIKLGEDQRKRRVYKTL